MSGIYDSAREAMGTGRMDVLAPSTLHIVRAGMYQPDLAQHSTIADVPADAILVSEPMSDRSFPGGVFKASDLLIEGVPEASYDGAVLCLDDGRLVAFLDAESGLSGRTLGGPVRILWDDRGIFKL